VQSGKLEMTEFPHNHVDYTIDDCDDRIEVSSDRPCTAGEYLTMEVRIRLAEPLPAGQGLAVMLPYGFDTPPVGQSHPPGFVTVTTSGGAAMRLTPYPGGFRRGVIAWLDDGTLPAEETVTFRLGNATGGSPGTRASVQAHQGLLLACYRVRNDQDVHVPILRNSPRVAVQPAPAATVRGFVTPTLGVGETGRLVLVAEDRFGNRVDDWAGTVSLRGAEAFAELPAELHMEAKHQGRLEATFTATHPGVFLPVACSPLGTSEVGPIEITPEPPEYRLYFGELHAHTELSYDAAGTLDELYTFARDTACLDFTSATDHMTAAVGRPGYGTHGGGIPGTRFDRFPTRWQATQDAARRYHEPGRFVTLLGFEFDTSGHSGHRNLYFKGDEAACIAFPTWPPPKGFLRDWAEGRDDIMIVPHHPPIRFTPGIVTDAPGLEYDTIHEAVQPFVEIYSKHGTSEYLHNPRPLRGQIPGHFVQDALNAGLHLGFVGGSDTHQANPGSSLTEPGPYQTLQYRSGLAAVWARDLTREALWEAFFARRIYATSYPRAILRVDVNDVPMGQIGTSPYPRQVRVFLAAPTEVNSVALVKNGEVIALDAGTTTALLRDSASPEITFIDETPSSRPEDHYYVRVTLSNGERLWSSPVWVRDG